MLNSSSPVVISASCHTFSLTHQSTCTLLCLGTWSTLGLVKTEDVKKVSALLDVEEEEYEFEGGWDILQSTRD